MASSIILRINCVWKFWGTEAAEALPSWERLKAPFEVRDTAWAPSGVPEVLIGDWPWPPALPLGESSNFLEAVKFSDALGELSVKNPWEELESCLELWIDCGLGLADCGLFPLGCGDLWTDSERK